MKAYLVVSVIIFALVAVGHFMRIGRAGGSSSGTSV
jgi:hypothetical protein